MYPSRMRTPCLAAVFLTLFAFASARAGEVNWQQPDFQSAMARAQRENKLIYIFVEGDNCPPCDSFKFSHLNDPVYADFINTLFVPIKCHEGRPADRAFLESLRLVHGAVPRFYVLSADGHAISMSIGMVSAPPMGPIDTLKMATGRELPVDRNAAAGLASRIRQYANTQRQGGLLYPDQSMRHIGIAAMEAWAWALAGRLDEAEQAWGANWATHLELQDLRYSYTTFWVKWNHNLPGALQAAQDYYNADPRDQAGQFIMGMALAANGRYEEAMQFGQQLLLNNPNNPAIEEEVNRWRQQQGFSQGAAGY